MRYQTIFFDRMSTTKRYFFLRLILKMVSSCFKLTLCNCAFPAFSLRSFIKTGAANVYYKLFIKSDDLLSRIKRQMISLPTENRKNRFQAKQFFVIVNRKVAVLQQNLEGREDVLKVFDWHQVAELSEAVEDRMKQLDAARHWPCCVTGSQRFENPEVDGEEDVGDVCGEAESSLSRFFTSGLQKLFVQFSALLLTLFLAFALLKNGYLKK